MQLNIRILLLTVCMIVAGVIEAKIPVDSTIVDEQPELVIVGKDTVSTIIPERNYSRFDRGLRNHIFVAKRDFLVGLTASYAEFNSDDVQVLSILKDLDFKGSIFSFKPYFAFFYRNNRAIGLRLSISNGSANLKSMKVDFDDDINFDLSDVSYTTSGFSGELFHRFYVGLDNRKRFGLFSEANLSFGTTSSDFKRTISGEQRTTSTTKTSIALNFCPGVTCFILDNVNFNLSYGIFSLFYASERQKTNGMDDGNRTSSGANFKFNLLNINFGIGVLF